MQNLQLYGFLSYLDFYTTIGMYLHNTIYTSTISLPHASKPRLASNVPNLTTYNTTVFYLSHTCFIKTKISQFFFRDGYFATPSCQKFMRWSIKLVSKNVVKILHAVFWILLKSMDQKQTINRFLTNS